MKKNTDSFLLILQLIIIVMVFGCAAVPKTSQSESPKPEGKQETMEVQETKKVAPPSPEAKKTVVHTEQETKSLEIFNQLLELVESSEDRNAILPEIERLYNKIISDYPDAPLAQESYWKLITIYVEDYSPPAYDRAEKKYSEFLKKYPQSFIKGFIEDTLGNSYYQHEEWKRLLELSTPGYIDYIEKGGQPRASLIFMYSEANYYLGNIMEAKKGYTMLSDMFPKLIVGLKAKEMLKKIGETPK